MNNSEPRHVQNSSQTTSPFYCQQRGPPSNPIPKIKEVNLQICKISPKIDLPSVSRGLEYYGDLKWLKFILSDERSSKSPEWVLRVCFERLRNPSILTEGFIYKNSIFEVQTIKSGDQGDTNIDNNDSSNNDARDLFQIFVGNVPLKCKNLKQKLRSTFSPFGIVKKVNICSSKRSSKKNNNRSRGYSFITFSTLKSVESVLEFGGQLRIGNNRIYCEEVKAKVIKDPHSKPENIMVSQSTDDVSYEAFQFKEGGEVKDRFRYRVKRERWSIEILVWGLREGETQEMLEKIINSPR